MRATKKMIEREIVGTFIQIKEYAQRAGATIEDVPKDIEKIELELARLKFLVSEYKKAPSDWREEFKQSKGK